MGTHQRSFECYRPIPDPLWPPFPQDWGSQPHINSDCYYLRNWWSYRLQIWPKHLQGPFEQTLSKQLGEKGAWVRRGTAQIFGVPPIISGTG